MEKKKYIQPEMQIEVLETEVMMLSASLNDTEVDTDSDQLALDRNQRRGKWGNLWAVED